MTEIKEEAPTNSMGDSCSVPGKGPIDTYDPMLMKKKKLLPFSVFRRVKRGKSDVGAKSRD